jgi:predicted Zn-dependent peptidase
MIYKREMIVLENGLRVIFDLRPNSDSFAACCMVNVGSLNDFSKKCGIAHFLEHFLFRSKLEDSNEYVEDRIYTHGGHLIGGTSPTFTTYFVSSHKMDAIKAIQYIGRTVCDLNINERLFREEKEVIIEEIIGNYPNTPNSDKLLLLGIPKKYHRPTAGTDKSIKTIELKDLQAFYNLYYTPKNMVLSVVGNFDKEEITNSIKKYFTKLPKSRSKVFKIIGFPCNGPKIDTSHYMSGRFVIYFVTRAFRNADLPVAKLLEEYFDYFIHKKYRMKKEHLYYISCDLDYNYNVGCFEFYFKSNPEKTERILLEFLHDLKDIKHNLVDIKTLNKIKARLIKKDMLGFENVLLAAKWYSCRELLTSKANPNDFHDYLMAVKKIKREAIKDFCQRLFSENNFSLDYWGKLDKKTKQEILDLIK